MHNRRSINDLSSLLDAVEGPRHDPYGVLVQNEQSGEHAVTVESILDRIGHGAHGPLLLAIGLISISPATIVPGATWLLAALTLVVALQVIARRPSTWMPRQALRVKVSQDGLARFVRAARPAAEAVDKLIRPRWRLFLEPPFVSVAALMCAFAALITFPLGLVPMAPLAPGLAVVLFGLGLTARDGLLLALGVAAVVATSVLILMRFA